MCFVSLFWPNVRSSPVAPLLYQARARSSRRWVQYINVTYRRSGTSYVDAVVIGCGNEVIARHKRCYDKEEFIYNPLHY
ncbi:MAG: hypothetical protein EXR27_23240, partial [Betaproteobacteria bacterium]|nr:hypothetical protein [Betaproteobacteria bacterium]